MDPTVRGAIWVTFLVTLFLLYVLWSLLSFFQDETDQPEYLKSYISELEMNIEQRDECIDSLLYEREELIQTIGDVDDAVSSIVGPGFGYYPPYEELIQVCEEASDVLIYGETGTMLHSECSF